MTKEKFREIINTILDNPGSRVTIVITEVNDDEGARMHDIIDEGHSIKIQRQSEGEHATRVDMLLNVSAAAVKNPAFDLLGFIEARVSADLLSMYYCKWRRTGIPLRVATNGLLRITYDGDEPETVNFRVKFGILNSLSSLTPTASPPTPLRRARGVNR